MTLPQYQYCASCPSGASLSYGACYYTVTQNIGGCYISSGCQGACGASETCTDTSGLFESCRGVGNAAGWNKYSCVDTCYSTNTCGGDCAASAKCEDTATFSTCYQCTVPTCLPGQYAFAGMCFDNVPSAPPSPASCPSLITYNGTRRLLGTEDADPAVPRRTSRALPSRRDAPVDGDAALTTTTTTDYASTTSSDGVEAAAWMEAIMEEDAAIQEAFISGAPQRMRNNPRKLYRRFRHLSELTGELTVLDTSAILHANVVDLDALTGVSIAPSVECARDGAGGNTVVVTLSLIAGVNGAALAASLCVGCGVVAADACDGAPLAHRVSSSGAQLDAAAGTITFVATPVTDAAALLNATSFTFFQGSPNAWAGHAGSPRVLRFDASVPEPTVSGLHGRRLLAGIDFPYTSGGIDVFNIASKNVYCDNAAIIACQNCKLTGSVNTLVTVDGFAGTALAQATGTLTLTLQAVLRLRGGASTTRKEITLGAPWCIPPVCYMLGFYSLGYAQAGLRFGTNFVSKTMQVASGDVNIAASAQLALNMATSSSSSPTYSLVLTQPGSSTSTRTPLTVSVDASLALKPVIQVGAWAESRGQTISFTLAAYGEASAELYVRVSGTYSETMLAANTALTSAASSCASPHNLELSAAIGIEQAKLTGYASGVFLSYDLGSSIRSTTPYASTPYVVWAKCVVLAPPPPPPLPPSPPAAPGYVAPTARPTLIMLTVDVVGYTAATFTDPIVQSSFKQGIASTLGVVESAVTISSFYDASSRRRSLLSIYDAAALHMRQRSLLASSLKVIFAVNYPSQAAADAGASSLSDAVSNGQLINQLRSAGLVQLDNITPVGTVSTQMAASAASSVSSAGLIATAGALAVALCWS